MSRSKVTSPDYPGRLDVAAGLPLIGSGFTLQNIDVLKSVTLPLHFFRAYSHFMEWREKV